MGVATHIKAFPWKMSRDLLRGSLLNLIIGLRTNKINRMIYMNAYKIISDSFIKRRHIHAIMAEGVVRRTNAS